MAKRVAESDEITEAIECLIPSVEPCRSFQVHKSLVTHQFERATLPYDRSLGILNLRMMEVTGARAGADCQIGNRTESRPFKDVTRSRFEGGSTRVVRAVQV